MTDSILVTGSGETTRANVEALVDDYFYSYPELTVYLAVHGSASQGQVWLAQYAIDKEKNIEAFITEGSSMMGIPATVKRTVVAKPIEHAISLNPHEVLILWSDEDTHCLDALALCKEHKLSARDLTEGLHAIVPAEGIQETVEAEMPEAELIPIQEVVSEPESFENSEAEDEEEEEYEDPLYEAINVVAQIFAEAIAKELKKVLKKQ